MADPKNTTTIHGKGLFGVIGAVVVLALALTGALYLAGLLP